MRIAIHQPNFFPWLPYFDKMREADVFVFLRHCQYEKGGYQNRFKLNDQWYTMPIHRGLEPLIDKRYCEPAKHWAWIAAQLPQYAWVLQPMADLVSESLQQTNMSIILFLKKRLGIGTMCEVDFPTETRGTERLVEIAQHFGATEYMSGPSGPKYMDMGLWEQAGIRVRVVYPTDTRHTLEVLDGTV